MEEPTEREDPNECAPSPFAASGAGTMTVTTTPAEHRRSKIEVEVSGWVALNESHRQTALREVIDGRCSATPEALVALCRRAFADGDRKTLNLAFEALGKRAAPLLLSQAWGLSSDKRREQVQEILLRIFAAIRQDKALYAETNFSSFAKRRAVELYRTRQVRFEGTNERIEPTEKVDPLDNIPSRLPSAEAKALLARSLDNLNPTHQAVFIQYHCFEMKQEEIAEHHGVSVRTVYSWLKKAEAAVGLLGEDNDR